MTDWEGRPENVPRTEKYDLKPYEPEDDDEYRTEEERAPAAPAAAAGGAKSGAVRQQQTSIWASLYCIIPLICLVDILLSEAAIARWKIFGRCRLRRGL